MAIESIPVESKAIIFKMIDVLKKEHYVGIVQIKDLERLKDKRKTLAKTMDEIEEGYKSQNIDEATYLKAKEKFDFDIKEIDLEILSRQKTIEQNKTYLRRLEILRLILHLKNENEVIKYKDRIFTINDLYIEYLKNVATETIKQLHFEQNFLRLKISYNQEQKVDVRHRFYASSELCSSLRDELYAIYDEIDTVNQTKINLNQIDFSKLTAADFIEADSKKLYDKLFTSDELKKQK